MQQEASFNSRHRRDVVTLIVRLSLMTATMLLLVPAGALAQTDSSIAEVLKDSTGAVLPGVTVEAASPALIERSRSAITDDQGQ